MRTISVILGIFLVLSTIETGHCQRIKVTAVVYTNSDSIVTIDEVEGIGLLSGFSQSLRVNKNPVETENKFEIEFSSIKKMKILSVLEVQRSKYNKGLISKLELTSHSGEKNIFYWIAESSSHALFGISYEGGFKTRIFVKPTEIIEVNFSVDKPYRCPYCGRPIG